MEEVGLDFRSTKDLAIVLRIGALTTEFFRAFWAFIEDGRYTRRQKSTDKSILYRLIDPKADIVGFKATGTLAPIPAGEGASSLSAIPLDTDYHDFLHRGIKHANGVAYAAPEFIIPLADLSERMTKFYRLR